MIDVLFRYDKQDSWEHLFCHDKGILISDRIESKRLTTLNVLKELGRLRIINLTIEEIE